MPQAAAAPFPVWTALWLAGMLLLAAWFTVSYVRSQRKFRTSLPVERGCAADWMRAHRHIAVRVSDQINAPLTYGFLRPVILLPRQMDWEDETALAHILTHEYMHIRHLDGVMKPALAAALCIHWFNPAVWLLYVLANRDIELACDEAVVRLLGRPAAYARTLLRMEETKAGCRPLYSHFSQNAIEERIKAIMQLKKISALAAVCALLLVAGVTTVFATSARQEPAQQPEAERTAGSWEPGKTYRFEAADGEEKDIDLTAHLPEQSGETAPAGEIAALSWPVQEGGTLSNSFGNRTRPGGQDEVFHSGIDIASVEGSVILAAADGAVAETGFNASEGNYLRIDHGNGLETVYAHCRNIDVQEGDAVKAGGMVGAVGSTGMSTGPHLHFEVRQDGELQDPLGYFSQETLGKTSMP